MTGSSFGDIIPYTNYEIFLTILTMLIGVGFYGNLFGSFEQILTLLRSDMMEKKYFFFNYF